MNGPNFGIGGTCKVPKLPSSGPESSSYLPVADLRITTKLMAVLGASPVANGVTSSLDLSTYVMSASD